ncbi:MAG: hypothetical protein JJD92_00020 [Frankiaceae bacterium]|nr:hypothetical protein [Frankiaceae bacterium]
MTMSFAALDVETANSARGSICSVGVAVVRDGVLVESWYRLVQPPEGLRHFDAMNSHLHGLGPADVAGQPGLAERLTELAAVLGDLPVVAHNAAFDIGALRAGCDAADVEWPTLTYGCSLMMARRSGLGLLSYRLPLVCAALGVRQRRHHHAGDDAEAAAQIVLALAARLGAASLEDLAGQLMVRLGHITRSSWAGCVQAAVVAGQRAGAADADPDHPLYGRFISFTGGLSITRVEASALAAGLGAVVQVSPTKTTDFLIIGDGFTGHTAEEFHTGRALKAVKVNAKGGHIEVLTEGEFLDLLAEPATSGVRTAAAIGA